MTRDEGLAILKMPEDEALEVILVLADKAARYDQMQGKPSPTTPSSMIPVYLKPSQRKSKKRPGQKKDHPGVARSRPEKVDDYQKHTLPCCPHCQTPVKKPIKVYRRTIEDLPPIEAPKVTEHTVYGYWCAHCKKTVFPAITEALPNANIGLRVLVFTAWLHYLVGVSVNNLVKLLAVFTSFKISAGGLTQAWKNLAALLEPLYNDLGQKSAQSALLHADETGWRLNGSTFWLWCFATKESCYYLITKSRGSPVLKKFFGTMFQGILICDFWGAYNKIKALAKQRCLYHLFTELAKVDKHNATPDWKAFRKKLSRLLKDALRLLDKKKQMDVIGYDRLKQYLYNRLDEFLGASYQDKDAQRLIKRLRRHQNELFTFLEHDQVSPYNNHAEQQMRKPVLTRKVSQQNRSDQGAKTQAILMSLFRTAELQGQNPIETVLAYAKKSLNPQPQPLVSLKSAA